MDRIVHRCQSLFGNIALLAVHNILKLQVDMASGLRDWKRRPG